MHSYTYIESDISLQEVLQSWNSTGINTIAMDFEGEFNLHIYGEHLCLIQVFDKHSFYIVDPFKVSKDALKEFLESQWLEKIMFDCSSDAALVRKQYQIHLANVYDVRVTATILGYNGNLSLLKSQCLGTDPVKGKKKHQMSNWLVRPLPGKMIEYALEDVEDLFTIREELDRQVQSRKLEKQVTSAQKRIAVGKGPDLPGYKKLPGYRSLSKDQKIYVRWFFESRDMLAKRMNVPAVKILEKSRIIEMAKQAPLDSQQLNAYAYHKDKSVQDNLVALMTVANEGACKEITHKSALPQLV